MSELLNRRKFINKSRLLQSVFNTKTKSFVRVEPGRVVEGDGFDALSRDRKIWRESIAHVPHIEIMKLLKQETDAKAVKRLLAIEQSSEEPRMTVVTMMKWKLNRLEGGDGGADSGTDSDESEKSNGANA